MLPAPRARQSPGPGAGRRLVRVQTPPTARASPRSPSVPLHPLRSDEAAATRSIPRKPRRKQRPTGRCRAGRGISHSGQGGRATRTPAALRFPASPWELLPAGLDEPVASRDTARVGKGWPTSGNESHRGSLQKQKTHLFLPPPRPGRSATRGARRQSPQGTRGLVSLAGAGYCSYLVLVGFFVANIT